MLLKLNTNSARCSGAWDKLTTVLNAIAAPTKSNTTDFGDLITAVRGGGVGSNGHGGLVGG